MSVVGWWKQHGYKFTLLVFLFLVFVTLVISLFTPERIRQQNYLEWVKFRNYIYSVQSFDIIGLVSCKKEVNNPNYATELEEFNKKVAEDCKKVKPGSTFWDWPQSGMCGIEFRPKLTATVDSQCSGIVKKEQWVTMFGKKIYMKSVQDLVYNQ